MSRFDLHASLSVLNYLDAITMTALNTRKEIAFGASFLNITQYDSQFFYSRIMRVREQATGNQQGERDKVQGHTSSP